MSVADRFSLPMAARTTKTGILIGLVFGGLQDLAGIARGRPIDYIDYIRGKFGGVDKTQNDEKAERRL